MLSNMFRLEFNSKVEHHFIFLFFVIRGNNKKNDLLQHKKNIIPTLLPTLSIKYNRKYMYKRFHIKFSSGIIIALYKFSRSD